jgi:hypothetical protein
MKIEDIKSMARAWNQVQETAHGKKEAELDEAMKPEVKKALAKASAITEKGKKAVTLSKPPFKMDEKMDPVDAKELKGKHKDRKDKDIDNDGDVDSSDKYLHKRRKAVSKAVGKDAEVELQTQEGKLDEAPQPKWKVEIGKKHYTVTARNTAEANKKANNLAVKDGNNGVGGKIERVAEAKDHGNMNNGSASGEGLSPSAKKQLANKTPMPDAVNEPAVDKKTFDTIRASGKKAPMRSNDNAAGEKNIKPSATQVKEDMNKTHTVDIDHTGGYDPDAKKHNISLKLYGNGPSRGAMASGKKKDLQKYLAIHYGGSEHAKDVHPEVH